MHEGARREAFHGKLVRLMLAEAKAEFTAASLSSEAIRIRRHGSNRCGFSTRNARAHRSRCRNRRLPRSTRGSRAPRCTTPCRCSRPRGSCRLRLTSTCRKGRWRRRARMPSRLSESRRGKGSSRTRSASGPTARFRRRRPWDSIRRRPGWGGTPSPRCGTSHRACRRPRPSRLARSPQPSAPVPPSAVVPPVPPMPPMPPSATSLPDPEAPSSSFRLLEPGGAGEISQCGARGAWHAGCSTRRPC